MENAFKAEWYDLADDDRSAFLDWLHGSHLPKIEARRGILWAGHYKISSKPNYMAADKEGRTRLMTDDPNCPTGSEYVLLTAASSPEVFFDPNDPPAPDAEAEEWLAKRAQYRQSIFIVEARINGPEYGRLMPGTGAPPAMQLGNFNVLTPEDDFVLADHYRHVRFKAIPKTPGCINLLKLVSVAGWPKHGILYNFTGMDEEEGEFEDHMREANAGLVWHGKSVREYVVHAPNAPHAGVRIWPAP